MSKAAEYSDAKLQSISWRRPGIAEIVAYSKFSTKAGESTKETNLNTLVSGFENVRLIDSHLENNGVVSKKVFRFQSSVPLASPTNADGPEAEKEQWSANVVMDQRDIALHPKIESILKAGWGSLYCGKVFWPRMIYKTVAEDEEENSGEQQKQVPVKNPFYGTTSYFCPRIEITRERYQKDTGVQIDGKVLNDIGWMDDAPEFPLLPCMQNVILTGNNTKRVQGSLVLKTEWQGGAGVFVKQI